MGKAWKQVGVMIGRAVWDMPWCVPHILFCLRIHLDVVLKNKNATNKPGMEEIGEKLKSVGITVKGKTKEIQLE